MTRTHSGPQLRAAIDVGVGVGARGCICAGLAAISIGPGASTASAGLWSAAATLGPAGASAQGDVAMDASGATVVAWVAAGGALRATVRPPGGVFAQATTLVPDSAGIPAVALDGSGRALVAW